MSGCWRKRGNAEVHVKAPIPRAVTMERVDPSLVTQGWVGDKPCLVTVDNGTYMSIPRPDIAAGWPERKQNQRYTLQTVSREALPFLKEIFLTLTLGRRH
jgi:hypothetical protein